MRSVTPDCCEKRPYRTSAGRADDEHGERAATSAQNARGASAEPSGDASWACAGRRADMTSGRERRRARAHASRRRGRQRAGRSLELAVASVTDPRCRPAPGPRRAGRGRLDGQLGGPAVTKQAPVTRAPRAAHPMGSRQDAGRRRQRARRNAASSAGSLTRAELGMGGFPANGARIAGGEGPGAGRCSTSKRARGKSVSASPNRQGDSKTHCRRGDWPAGKTLQRGCCVHGRSPRRPGAALCTNLEVRDARRR